MTIKVHNVEKSKKKKFEENEKKNMHMFRPRLRKNTCKVSEKSVHICRRSCAQMTTFTLS